MKARAGKWDGEDPPSGCANAPCDPCAARPLWSCHGIRRHEPVKIGWKDVVFPPAPPRGAWRAEIWLCRLEWWRFLHARGWVAVDCLKQSSNAAATDRSFAQKQGWALLRINDEETLLSV